MRDDKPICEIATSVRNQRGEVCLSGDAVTYTVTLHPPLTATDTPEIGV